MFSCHHHEFGNKHFLFNSSRTVNDTNLLSPGNYSLKGQVQIPQSLDMRPANKRSDDRTRYYAPGSMLPCGQGTMQLPMGTPCSTIHKSKHLQSGRKAVSSRQTKGTNRSSVSARNPCRLDGQLHSILII